METALIYNGSPIGERDEMLCLTDMWRASGAPENKRPNDWVASAQAREFADFIAGNSGIELFQTVRGGQEPGTWAHWQLGMAYAKYLSPEFHAWCNEVVRAHMESRNLPMQVIESSLKPMTFEDFERAMAPRDEKLDNILNFVSKSRKECSVEDYRKLLDNVVHSYAGFCPCGCERNIVASDGQFIVDGTGKSLVHLHHQNGPHRNSFADFIPLFKDCHERIENDPMERMKFARAFEDYHRLAQIRTYRKPKQLKLI